MSTAEERAELLSILSYLFKNLPTCLESFSKEKEMESKRKISKKVAAALSTYFTVYRQKYVPSDRYRMFRQKQIAQVYQSLLSEGNVKCPEAWHKALKLEADREEKFVKGTLTNTTKWMLTILMEKFQVPSEKWYFFLNTLMTFKQRLMGLLPNGNVMQMSIQRSLN